jgi:copper(I)-binding protein
MRYLIGILLLLASASVWAGSPYMAVDPFVRATPMKISAGYVTLKNATDQEDKLLRVTADWAGKIELHTIKENTAGVLEMKEVPHFNLPAKGQLVLQSGGNHIMLYQLKKPLQAGETVTLVFHFERAPAQEYEFKVQPITYKLKSE